MRPMLAFIAILAVVLAACGGGSFQGEPLEDDTPADAAATAAARPLTPPPPGTPRAASATATGAVKGSASGTPVIPAVGRGSMSAQIDGEDWSSDGVIFATYLGGVLGVSGGDRTQPTRAIAFSVQITGPGEVQISPQGLANANAVISVGSSIWMASVISGTGTIEVTTLTPTGASGTFSFKAEAAPNSANTGTKDITDGVFDVTFTSIPGVTTPTPGAFPTTAPSRGATTCAGAVTATANGEPWCSTGLVRASHENRFFSITAFDATYGVITFGLGQVTGPGTYSLAYLNGNGSSAIAANPAGQGWNTFLPGGTGTMTIETLTATSAKGTFSFDAVPASGRATGNYHATDGRFNVTLAAVPGVTTPPPAAIPGSPAPARGALPGSPAPTRAALPTAAVPGTTACDRAVTAIANGQPWCGGSTFLASHRNDFFSITAFDVNATGITFGLGQVKGPGTYSLAYLNGNGSSALAGNPSGQGWTTFLPGGTGEITIETLTATRATGTFSFEAVPVSGGATGNFIVTDGKFDVTLQAAASK